MTAVVMSNPGLHLAVLGNPGSRRKKRKGKKMATAKQKAAARRNIKKAQRANRKKYKTRTRRKARGVKVIFRRKGKHRRKTNRKFGARRRIKTGRRGTVSYRSRSTGRLLATNPRKRRKSRRRNPNGIAKGLRGWSRGLTTAPAGIMKTFTGKNVMKNTAWLAGGTVAAYIAGGFTAKFASPILAMIPGVPAAMQRPMVQRIVGASMNYTAGYVISMFIKDKELKTAIQLGGALAAGLEFIAPGMMGQWVSRIPLVGQTAATAEAAAGPVNGLGMYYGGPALAGFMGEYVDASAYQGAGEYVDASAYQGAGELNEYVDASAYQGAGDDDALAEYVDASAYQGAGDNDMLAGSYLDEADMFQSYI